MDHVVCKRKTELSNLLKHHSLLDFIKWKWLPCQNGNFERRLFTDGDFCLLNLMFSLLSRIIWEIVTSGTLRPDSSWALECKKIKFHTSGQCGWWHWWGSKNPQRGPLFFEYFRQSEENQWPSLFCHFCSKAIQCYNHTHAPAYHQASTCSRVWDLSLSPSAPNFLNSRSLIIDSDVHEKSYNPVRARSPLTKSKKKNIESTAI